MAGRKQHYIPQSILREFGTKQRNDEYKIHIFERSRNTRPSNTARVAFENDFYYSPVSELEKTNLDEKITNFEGELRRSHLNMLNAIPGHIENTEDIINLVCHLSIRTANLRKSFAAGITDVANYVADAISDEDRVLGIFSSGSNAEWFRESIQKIYDDSPVFRNNGISIAQFRERMRTVLYDNKSVLAQYGALFAQVVLKSPLLNDALREGHNNSLRSDLNPKGRANMVREFKWKKIESESENILSDSVVIGISEKKIVPFYMFGGDDELDGIYMPLSSSTHILGYKHELDRLPDIDRNLTSARCSLDFFIARSHSRGFEEIKAEIGVSIDSVVAESTEKAISKMEY